MDNKDSYSFNGFESDSDLSPNKPLFLARQVFPEDSGGLFKAYLEATQRPHGYIVLDLSQDGDDRLSYRTNIFPPGFPRLYMRRSEMKRI